jgi:hypothetical protein
MNITDITEYDEIYRIYEFKVKRRPVVLEIYNKNNIWYFSHYWIEIIGEVRLFEDNNITYIIHEDKYLLDEIIIKKHLNKIRFIDKLRNYTNYDYFDLDMYYIEYKNNRSSGVVIFNDFYFKSRKHIRIKNIFNEILSSIK